VIDREGGGLGGRVLIYVCLCFGVCAGVGVVAGNILQNICANVQQWVWTCVR